MKGIIYFCLVAACIALIGAVPAGDWTSEAEYSVAQDTTFRAIRLAWANQSGAERLIIIGPDTTRLPYDSVRYGIQIRSPDLVVLDSIFGDTTYVWTGGTAGQPYFASGQACGYLGADIACAPRGDELQIRYPYPVVTETSLVPMQLLADTVVIQQ
jgi:hypothetical protein